MRELCRFFVAVRCSHYATAPPVAAVPRHDAGVRRFLIVS